MPSPSLEESEGDGDADEDLGADTAAEDSAAADEAEPNVVQADITDDDLAGDNDPVGDGPGADSGDSDLFSGVEDTATGDDSDTDGDGAEDDEEGAEDPFGGLGDRGEGIEAIINEGAATLATAGIQDEETQEDLQDEFERVFEGFQLGYFGSRFAQEYVFTEEGGEIDPAWGLLGTSLVCAAFVLHRRPDGDEIVDGAQGAVSNIAGGAKNLVGGAA